MTGLAPTRAPIRRRPAARHVALLLLLLLLLLEGLSLAACAFLRSRGLFYTARAGDYPAYLARRHPVLGWPPLTGDPDPRDAIGSRPVPAFPDPTSPALVSLYGDSFTWGATVEPADAWGNVLATMLGGRVNNFGVRGYGSDQAFLRYRLNQDDHAPLVILAHLSENVARNLNQLRDLLGGAGQMAFKPRFDLDDAGHLLEIPLPALTPEEYLDCARRPERHLRHETFLPGSPDGPRPLRFPFTASLLRTAMHPRVRAALRGEPWYASLYRPDHPARGLEVTARVLEAFAREARARGQRPLILLIPTGLDLEHHARTRAWPYHPLVRRLDELALPFLDAGPPMARRMQGRAIAEIFTGGDTGGHLNAEGYRVLAEVVAESIRSSGERSP